MQIVLIVIFAVLLSLPGRAIVHPVYAPLTEPAATLAVMGLLSLLLPLGLGWGSWKCVRLLRRPGGFARASALFGRVHGAMRLGMLLFFGLLISQTGWLRLVERDWSLARWPLLDELVVVAPVLVASILSWLLLYPADRALRHAATAGFADQMGQPIWSLGQYLDFQVRNQVLTVVVPMSLFVLAADLMARYGRSLVRWSDLLWLPEAVLAVVAGAIFVVSPVMLRYIWRTQRLADSPLRDRLEETCRRLGLRYRDILVWKSHGSMVNAAVMGLLPPLRYILLSDGLLDHLSGEQVEAVFGHEAGHVRERHITYYMIFAIASMVAVSLAGDGLGRGFELSPETVQILVAAMVAFLWIVVFGWISRRFERQADLHGVRCLDGSIAACDLPCWRHNMTGADKGGERLCTTGAQVFASALEAVAALNGISKYARSWRHSSIASRQDFVRQAAMYPQTLERFERMIRRIKTGLLAVTLLLSVLAAWTYWPQLQRRPGPIPQYQRRPAIVVQAPDATPPVEAVVGRREDRGGARTAGPGRRAGGIRRVA